MDALSLLARDHGRVKGLLEDLEDTDGRAHRGRTEALATLRYELEIHEAIEEEIFYPALQEHAEAKAIVLEAFAEHEVLDTIMGELDATAVEDETWSARFAALKENLEHHIEEEDEMFSRAREVMDEDELDALGERMHARKEQLFGADERG